MSGQEPVAAEPGSVPDGIKARLRTLVGLEVFDESEALHMRLAYALGRQHPNQPEGVLLVAVRYVFNWELREAGAAFASARAGYDRLVARTKMKLLAEDPKMSVAKAEIYAEADDAVYGAKLGYMLAEQRERALRNFLQTIASALDNHRTDRADARAADQAHARGLAGGA